MKHIDEAWAISPSGFERRVLFPGWLLLITMGVWI
jgi:hypothetical protein